MYILPVTGFIHHTGERVVYDAVIICTEDMEEDEMVVILVLLADAFWTNTLQFLDSLFIGKSSDHSPM